MAKKYVYLFTEGNASMRELLGGKGANLAEMTNIGLPVPQGFTITTEACTQYYEDGRKINDEIKAQIMEYISKMEKITGKKFGDHENPLLVSVRSGARASMPGMMDTILNLGLNEEVVEGYRRQVQQSPLGVGLLPPLHPDVLRRGYGSGQEVLRKAHRRHEGKEGRDLRHRAGPPRTCTNWPTSSRPNISSSWARTSPTIPRSSCSPPSRPFSVPGTTPAPTSTAWINDIPYSWGTAVNVQIDGLRQHGRRLAAPA